MRAAAKVSVTIPKDRLVQLPDDFPEGRAEIIVLYSETSAMGDGARPATKSLTPAATSRVARADQAIEQSKHPKYFARLKSRQPVPLSHAASRALDEADRGER